MIIGLVLINKGRRFARTVENMKMIRQYLARNNGAKTNDIAKMMELSTARTRAILYNMDDIKSTGEYKERRYWLKK